VIAHSLNASALAANRALLKAIAPQQEGLQKNLEYFKAAIEPHAFGTQEAREQLLQGAAQLASAEGVPNEVKAQFYEYAATEMQKQMQESPLDARFPLFLGVLHGAYGQQAQAEAMLRKALELSPKKQSIMYEIASNLYTQGRTADALAMFKQAFDVLPENKEARIVYAAAAITIGQGALADQLLAPIISTGQAADPRIASAYAGKNQYGKIAEIWEGKVAADPTDAQAYFTLAAAYYGAGNTAKAIAVLQDVGTKIPAAKAQADALIEEVRAGRVQL
jgi:cytochrome c-type biogenesis protein CcmH/NrfG